MKSGYRSIACILALAFVIPLPGADAVCNPNYLTCPRAILSGPSSSVSFFVGAAFVTAEVSGATDATEAAADDGLAVFLPGSTGRLTLTLADDGDANTTGIVSVLLGADPQRFEWSGAYNDTFEFDLAGEAVMRVFEFRVPLTTLPGDYALPFGVIVGDHETGDAATSELDLRVLSPSATPDDVASPQDIAFAAPDPSRWVVLFIVGVALLVLAFLAFRKQRAP